jgi:hypothetical protein
MPNRILREGILDSERVNRLDEEEENFFRRLMSVVDDHGRYEAHRAKLRARMYPLKLDTKSEQRIGDLLLACVRERVVYVYPADGKTCLQVLNFRQQTRSESKYPAPDAKHMKSFAMQTLSPAEMQKCLAHAQQMIAGAHLGVFVFEGVSVGGVVVVDRSRSRDPAGPRAEPDTDTPPAAQLDRERKPKDLAAVIAFGAARQLSEDECQRFFQYNKARSWKAASPDGWRALLLVWQQRAAERAASADGVGAKNSPNAGGVAFDPEKPNAHTGGLELVN